MVLISSCTYLKSVNFSLSQSNKAELWYELLGPEYSSSSSLSPKEQFHAINTHYFPIVTGSHLLKYNLSSREWKSLKLSSEKPDHYDCISIALTMERDVFATGAYLQPDTFLISRLTGEVEELSPLQCHRTHIGLVQHEGNMYAFGGAVSYHSASSAEIYEYRRKQWRRLCDSKQERYSFTPAYYKDHFYLVGGHSMLSESFHIPTETYSFLPQCFNIYRVFITFFKESELVVLQGNSADIINADTLSTQAIAIKSTQYQPMNKTQAFERNGAYCFYSTRNWEVAVVKLEDLSVEIVIFC